MHVQGISCLLHLDRNQPPVVTPSLFLDKLVEGNQCFSLRLLHSKVGQKTSSCNHSGFSKAMILIPSCPSLRRCLVDIPAEGAYSKVGNPIVHLGYCDLGTITEGLLSVGFASGTLAPRDGDISIRIDESRHVSQQLCIHVSIIPLFVRKQHGGRCKIDGAWGGRKLDSRIWSEFPKIE